MSMCVCVCQVSVCAGTHAFQRVSFALFMYFGAFLSVCVHLRPLAPHHQDTGLNGGSYSPLPTLLSQQVAPNVLFSLRKLLAFLLFFCSYLFFFFVSSPLSSSHTRTVSSFLALLAFCSPLTFFLSFISGSLPSHISFLGQKKDKITGSKCGANTELTLRPRQGVLFI